MDPVLMKWIINSFTKYGMKNILQLSDVATKIFNILTLARKANHGSRSNHHRASHIPWHRSIRRSWKINLRARRNSHLLNFPVICNARPEQIKLSLGNLHLVHDGLIIFFTVAAEELDIEEHLLLAGHVVKE